MKLYEIISGVDIVSCNVRDVDIKNIVIDSRCVGVGDMFVAMDGKCDNGIKYVHQAIVNGAIAVLTDRYIAGVPCVVVDNVRQAYSLISQNFYDNPSKNLKIIAVVGTNGKSTTANFIYDIMKFNGYKIGFIGTGEVKFDNEVYENEMTTPDPIDMNRYFRMMRDAGIDYVVMEVSAHAIYLDKMYGIKCEMGLFTNFSEDHLDFFNEMDIYKRVKISFFNSRYIKVGIVNSDDECGRKILNSTDVPVFTYGLDCPSDVFAIDLEYAAHGSRFVVNMLDEISTFATEIIGKYNIYNIIAASLVARLIGIPLYAIRDAVSALKMPEGRYNVIKTSRADFIVDYAHTPCAMRDVIIETRKIHEGRLITVFGCGGNRDKKKRSIMGNIASTLSDEVILTADNSRNENTLDIIEDIKGGITNDNVTVLEDRYEAIKYAYEISNSGDVVLVLGKGAEKYQDNGDGKIYYSDSEAILHIAK